MRYFKTSIAAIMVAYILTFSNLGYLFFSWRYELPVDSRKFLTLLFCGLTATGIGVVAHKIESRTFLAKWKKEAESKFGGIS